MRRLMSFAVAALLLSTGVAWSTTVIPPTFEELVSRARLIFVGQAINEHAYWVSTPQGRAIKTVVTFRVEDTWKGSVGAVTQLEFLGGELDGLRMAVSGMPRFANGQRDVLFVTGAVRTVSPLVGFMHGRVKVEREVASGADRVRTFDGRALSTTMQFGPARAPVAEGAPSMRLADFKALVLNQMSARAR